MTSSNQSVRFTAHFNFMACVAMGRQCAAKHGPHAVALLVSLLLVGCGDAPQAGDPPMGLVVYVDLPTQSPIVQLGTSEVPAVHPETGRRTLMPGLYCPKCQRWHPAPSYDKLQRTPGAALCPKDGTPLTIDGPWPQGNE